MSDIDPLGGQLRQWGRGGASWPPRGETPPDPSPAPSPGPPLPPEPTAGGRYGVGRVGASASSLPPEPPQPEPPVPEPPTPPIPPVPPVPEPVEDHSLPPLPDAGGTPDVASPPSRPPWLRDAPLGAPPPGSPGRFGLETPPLPPATTPAEAEAAAPAAVPPPPPPWAAPPPPAPVATTGAAAAIEADATPRAFGDRMATGVLLTLAAGSAAAGGILALQQTDSLSFTTKALVTGGAAALLLAAAVVLRLVRGSEDLRGALAVIGIAFAAACLAFAYDPANAGDHDNVVKFALGAGIVTVLGWFAAIVVPSAVAGLLASVALPAAVGAGVWLGFESPTHVQVYVAALCVGLLLAVLLPRVAFVRPHPGGLGWALSGAAVAVTLPAIELLSRGDAVAVAAGATAAAGLLLLAQRHRNLVCALGALAGLAALEGELVSRYLGTGGGGSVATQQLVGVAVIGGVLVVLIGLGVLLSARGRAWPRWPAPRVVGPAELLLLAALALALVALATGPGDVPFNPPQLSSGSTATYAGPHAIHVRPA